MLRGPNPLSGFLADEVAHVYAEEIFAGEMDDFQSRITVPQPLPSFPFLTVVGIEEFEADGLNTTRIGYVYATNAFNGIPLYVLEQWVVGA
jgi:hypothetical protein